MVLKLLQILGVLLLAGGVAAQILDAYTVSVPLIALGALVYAVARLTAWLRRRGD